MDLAFVSTNVGKFREVRSILGEYGVRVRWDRRRLPEVQADDLASVVEAKLADAARSGQTVLVEDSGLFIPALDGFPGVYSAYAFKTIGLRGMLTLTRGRARGAVFRTVAGLARGSRQWTVSGECRGRLADRPRGRNGFGYDPIFIPNGETRTFGQFDPVEKNRRSHRAQAIRRVGRLLQTLG
ncbi:MAG: non-canonical purine NTP pyrophosphatase [Thermoplasmata archaeon]|nr:non-canonical purine NTP pyrophosphatase [Thermoplasmata archaeon]